MYVSMYVKNCGVNRARPAEDTSRGQPALVEAANSKAVGTWRWSGPQKHPMWAGPLTQIFFGDVVSPSKFDIGGPTTWGQASSKQASKQEAGS